MKKGFLWILVLISALLIGPAASQAALVLDFEVAPPYAADASISYAGGIAPLVGNNLAVTDVISYNTPLNPNTTVPLVDAVLNFTTGPNSSDWTWGPGGEITITDGTDFLTGTFQTAEVIPIGENNFKIVGASFLDTKSERLLNFFGLPVDRTYLGNMNISFFASADVGCQFTSYEIGSGDVLNSVPEPASMLLLGFGLMGVAGVRRLSKK